mmetsp:Transcript_27772/g.69315  ORF Transcript_27772/g.69315 Transcript_27772/m.69315 type:complete len:277 (-) Transcript_27772:1970-2800(-)
MAGPRCRLRVSLGPVCVVVSAASEGYVNVMVAVVGELFLVQREPRRHAAFAVGSEATTDAVGRMQRYLSLGSEPPSPAGRVGGEESLVLPEDTDFDVRQLELVVADCVGLLGCHALEPRVGRLDRRAVAPFVVIVAWVEYLDLVLVSLGTEALADQRYHTTALHGRSARLDFGEDQLIEEALCRHVCGVLGVPIAFDPQSHGELAGGVFRDSALGCEGGARYAGHITELALHVAVRRMVAQKQPRRVPRGGLGLGCVGQLCCEGDLSATLAGSVAH